MAGKADLVHSIVDPVGARLPVHDGWGTAAEADEEWPYASLFTTSPPDTTIKVGSGTGGGGANPPPPQG
jgi:hypothetical protein